MSSPESAMPSDPFLEQDFEKSIAMERMSTLGINQGLIELLRDDDYALESDMLAAIIGREARLGTSAIEIDAYAIKFVYEHAPQFFEDALVEMVLQHPEWDSTL